MSFIQLRADCFFRHWSLQAKGIDEEGCVLAIATPTYPERRQISAVELRIDPLTSYLIEYRYTDDGRLRAFILKDGEYVERAPQQERS
jgi:hypothetical protein